MQKIILNLLLVALIGLVIPACSKKNSTVAQTNKNERVRSQNRGNQPRGGKGERPQFADMLTKMDANKDGKLSQAEAQGRLKDGFSEIDANKDGFITEAEFKNAPRPPRRGRN